jgi:hypothetical protein
MKTKKILFPLYRLKTGAGTGFFMMLDAGDQNTPPQSQMHDARCMMHAGLQTHEIRDKNAGTAPSKQRSISQRIFPSSRLILIKIRSCHIKEERAGGSNVLSHVVGVVRRKHAFAA